MSFVHKIPKNWLSDTDTEPKNCLDPGSTETVSRSFPALVDVFAAWCVRWRPKNYTNMKPNFERVNGCPVCVEGIAWHAPGTNGEQILVWWEKQQQWLLRNFFFDTGLTLTAKFTLGKRRWSYILSHKTKLHISSWQLRFLCRILSLKLTVVCLSFICSWTWSWPSSAFWSEKRRRRCTRCTAATGRQTSCSRFRGPSARQSRQTTWRQLYKIGLPGKLILRDYFQENRGVFLKKKNLGEPRCGS